MDIKTAVKAVVAKHGGVRAAARAIKVNYAYLSRLQTGEKSNPTAAVLRKLGLRKVVHYEADLSGADRPAVRGRIAGVEAVTTPQSEETVSIPARGCDHYSRPKGVMGGPCLNCGCPQPDHVHRTPKCPHCGRLARRQLMGTYVCDFCSGRAP